MGAKGKFENEEVEKEWWYLTRKKADKMSARRMDAMCIRDLLFAKRLLDFIEEFPAKDPDVGYARAAIRLTEMCFSAGPCLYLRGVADIKPDIVARADKKYGVVWGTCLTIGCYDHSRARVRSIELVKNFAIIELDGTEMQMRFGDNLEILYRRFLKANPEPPGDGVYWNFGVNPNALGFYAPALTKLDPAWRVAKESYDVAERSWNRLVQTETDLAGSEEEDGEPDEQGPSPLRRTRCDPVRRVEGLRDLLCMGDGERVQRRTDAGQDTQHRRAVCPVELPLGIEEGAGIQQDHESSSEDLRRSREDAGAVVADARHTRIHHP